MPTACINQHDCRVSLKSERLEVFGRNEQTQRDEVLREIPIRDLDRLIMAESVQITSQAMAALFVSVNNGAVETEPRLTPLQRHGCAYAGLAGLGFQRLGSTSLTS